MESTAFYIILFVHLISLVAAFGAVMVTDFFGLRWTRNQIPFARVVQAADTTGRMVWIGWLTLVASGIPLLVLKASIDELMILKLFCVGLAGANGLALHAVLKRLRTYEHADAVPSLLVFRLLLSLMLSQVAWWGALLIGFLHRHIWDSINWPPRPLLVIAAFSAGAIIIGAAGELILRRRPSRVKVEATEDAEKVVTGPGPTIDPLGKEQ